MSLLENLIDEDVLADARKIDKLTRKYDPGRPSIEKTLRLVRDVNTDVVRRVGREVWGVGGTEGADLVRTSFDSCVTELDRAVTQASAWTGEAKNAYGDRINQIKGGEGLHRGLHCGLHAMRSPAEDVGQALVAMGDSFDEHFGKSVADIFTAIGLVVAVLGVAVAVGTWETGIGAVLGMAAAILGLRVAVVCQIASENSYHHKHVTACEEASAAASRTLSSARLAGP